MAYFGAVNWPSECCVVIPCLNEARTIGAVVAGARRFLPSVLVVDDGGSDGTGAVASAAGAVAIRHSVSQGKGEALRSGFNAALERGFSWAIAMDGDGQHSVEDIPNFLAGAREDRMVIGNRMTSAREIPLLRRAVNRWMSRRLADFCGVEAPDTQCGFRMIHLPSWRSLRLRARHFEIESELFVRFAAAGYSIGWVPVRVRYGRERSKIRPLRDTARWFRWWIDIRRELAASGAALNRPIFLHDPA
jgi:glycosyltransferase involved in cell wall biosynthesis